MPAPTPRAPDPSEPDGFRDAIDRLPVLVWVTDEDLRIVEQRGGALTEQLTPVGVTLTERWGEEDSVGAVRDHRRALAGESVQSEATIAGRTLSFRLEPRRHGDAIVGVAGLGTDITAERELQGALAHAQRLDAIARLTGGIAHDFNNMLLAIIANLDLALARIDDPDARRRLGAAHDAAARSSDLIRQLLVYARRQVLEPRLLDVNAEIERTTEFLGAGLGGARVVCDLGEVPAIRADPTQFEQVLVNLIVNASDAGGGEIAVTSRARTLTTARAVDTGELAVGTWVEIAVADDGPGIDAETRGRLFEPFFTTKERGTGLGLSSVFGIVLQHGGQLQVDSEPGSGATFRAFFPVAA